jgi:hypothetical protein
MVARNQGSKEEQKGGVQGVSRAAVMTKRHGKRTDLKVALLDLHRRRVLWESHDCVPIQIFFFGRIFRPVHRTTVKSSVPGWPFGSVMMPSTNIGGSIKLRPG